MFGVITYTDIIDMNNNSEGVFDEIHYSDETSLSEAIDRIYDATVMIENINYNGNLQGSGTGFVYKLDDEFAYIATNYHVIDDANSLNIVFSDYEKVDDIEIIGSDKYVDIAVLRMPKEHARLIAILGDNDDISLGDTVFTVGSPLGERFIGTVTRGVLSGKDRSVPVYVNNTHVVDWEMDVLQTDAAINPGNSGGPLLNNQGEVIGINSLKLVQDEVEGMGFAIPINDAKKYIEDIEAFGKVVRPTLGISMYNVEDLSINLKEQLNLSNAITSGVYVASVINGTPAKKAGILDNDIIIAYNGNSINNIAELRKYLYQNKPGDEIEIELIRNNQSMILRVLLDDTPLD